MNFENFLGNEKIKEQISYLFESKKLPHALILEGDDGLGKRTLAREIALAAVCRESIKPCRLCSQCKKALSGVHPDIIERSVPDGKKVFKVETVREVINDCFVKPNESDYKIYILGNAHYMNSSAQNALLKILEEPPEYAIFILTVKSKSMMLETVLSRSCVFSLNPVNTSEAAEFICKKCADASLEQAKNTLTEWNGNIGKAIEALTSGKASEVSDIADRICRALVNDNEFLLLKECSSLDGDRQLTSNVLNFFKLILRDALLFEQGGCLSGRKESAELLYKRLSKQKLMTLIECTDSLCTLPDKNINNSLMITKICCNLKEACGK